MNIGENILKMRKEKGITQEQLADVLCISAGAVSKWETESSTPDISMLPKIADFFGVSIDKIFGFELTESDTPENIIKKVEEITVGFNYEESSVKFDDIKVVMKCDEAISILTDACIKFPNNYTLKSKLCWYKNLSASKHIKEPENYKKAKREVLDELYSITRLTNDIKIADDCFNIIGQIYIDLGEYDKALETSQRYVSKQSNQMGYNQTILTSLLKLGKEEEAEKHAHNITYISLAQIYTGNISSFGFGIIKDIEKIKKTSWAMINMFKIFSDSPGPFDFYMSESYKLLALIYLGLEELDESMKCFEESYNYAESFKIFSENREIISDFIKCADKHRFLYNIPYDSKKHLLSAFEAMENMDANTNDYKNYMELKNRDDFQQFISKIKE